MDPHRTYEIRCPIHGFITLNDWELTVVSQPSFQRLRRIRQLAWTDYVYPGAMHTRFDARGDPVVRRDLRQVRRDFEVGS